MTIILLVQKPKKFNSNTIVQIQNDRKKYFLLRNQANGHGKKEFEHRDTSKLLFGPFGLSRFRRKDEDP